MSRSSGAATEPHPPYSMLAETSVQRVAAVRQNARQLCWGQVLECVLCLIAVEVHDVFGV